MGISINVYFKSTASNLPRHRQATRPSLLFDPPPRSRILEEDARIESSLSFILAVTISTTRFLASRMDTRNTLARRRGGEVPLLPEGKDFPRRGAKLIRAGPEILFRSLAINAKRLTGQSSPGGVNPKGVRTVLSDVHTSVVS